MKRTPSLFCLGFALLSVMGTTEAGGPPGLDRLQMHPVPLPYIDQQWLDSVPGRKQAFQKRDYRSWRSFDESELDLFQKSAVLPPVPTVDPLEHKR